MSENSWNEPKESELNSPEPSRSKPDLAADPSDKKAWKLMERLIDSLTLEQRRSRRWGIFFKLLTFGYLFGILGVFLYEAEFSADSAEQQTHTAIIAVNGPISAEEEASADNIISALRTAYKTESAKGIILRINSPGGSPVQSGYIYDEIKRLGALYPNKKVYAVITDIGASGAYYIAAAADQIYADKASLVGSIGVVAGGFGYVDLMEKLGVERRLYTAGEHKAFLDPFSPQNQQETELWQKVLNTTHNQFIEQVRKGRGDKLKESPEIFSGLVWTGEQALQNGLIDGLGSSSFVAREIIGEEKIVDYGYQPKPWEAIVEQLGVSMGKTIATSLGITPFKLQ